MKTVKEKLVDVCIIVTITLAMLLGAELAARAAKYAKSVFFPAPEGPSTILKQPWGRQYRLDEGGMSVRHVDYVEFRERPYRSATITIDEQGRRRVPGNCERPDAFTVWTFGGSTMLGQGAPDESTIPAHLAGILNRDGRCANVVNFGAGSWQSSQELIQLIELLKRGHRPHAVIFYDGVNDSSSDRSPGGIDDDARAILNQAFRAHEMSILELVAQRSVLVSIVSNRLPGIRRSASGDSDSTAPTISPALARARAGIYAENVRVADLLAREYGFSAYFFLQPYPQLSRKKLTPTESGMIEPESRPRSAAVRDMDRAYYRAFGEAASAKAPPRYFDISGIFDGLAGELFASDAHLLPEGNRIVAERIAGEIVLPPVAR